MQVHAHKLKVAEHSFQEPMPNSPLLLGYLCFGARFFARVKVNHRKVYSRILAKVCAVTMATGLVKNKTQKMVFVYFKKVQSLDFFHFLPTTN